MLTTPKYGWRADCINTFVSSLHECFDASADDIKHILHETIERKATMEGSKTPEQAIAQKRSFEEQQDEDSATMKASEDLKHTRISDKEPTEGEAPKNDADIAKPLSGKDGHTSGFTKETTPEPSTRSGGEDDGMMEQISSPKKKRVREQDDETKESDGIDKVNKERVPSNGSATSAGRSDRLEPEKKRHRDTLEGGADAAGVAASQQVR